MNINRNEVIIACDVDETLIIHNIKKYPHLPRVQVNYYGHKKIVSVHTEHVMLLKAYKKRGYYVRAHSANGWQSD